MDYYESAEGITITLKRAMYEIVDKHGASWEEFVADCGEHDSYDAQAVLAWLGY